jgi:hypothetical protein
MLDADPNAVGFYERMGQWSWRDAIDGDTWPVRPRVPTEHR